MSSENKTYSKNIDNGAGVNIKDTQAPISSEPESPGPSYLNYSEEIENEVPVMMGSPMAPMFVQLMKDPEEKTRRKSNITLISIMIFAIFMLFLPSIIINQKSNPGDGSGTQNFGLPRNHTIFTDHKDAVTFDDIHGCNDIKKELQSVVDFLNNPEKFKKSGATIPHGYLLAGPPGVGKTMLAKALAGEANKNITSLKDYIPFITISGSEFNEMFVGVGVSRVKALFADARSFGKAIIFIDEIDALAMRRESKYNDGSSTERAVTLNQLLVEMDGFNTQEGIFVLAATNAPDALDPAIKRPGRFDKTFILKPPNKAGRLSHLKAKIEKCQVEGDLKDMANLSVLVEKTAGFTGAQIDNLVNRAKTELSNDTNINPNAKLSMKHFLAALNFLDPNSSSSRPLLQFEKVRKAYGEAGLGIIQDHYRKTKKEYYQIFDSNVNDAVLDKAEEDDEDETNTLLSLQTLYEAEVYLDQLMAKSVAEEMHLTEMKSKKNINSFDPKKHVQLSSNDTIHKIHEVAQYMLKSNNESSWFKSLTISQIITDSQNRIKKILNERKSDWETLAKKLIGSAF